MCSTTNIFKNPLNSFDVNWLSLSETLKSETLKSGTLNPVNSSCRNPITTPVVGFLHLNISGHLEKLSTMIK